MERNYHVYSYSELADMHLMYGMGRCNSSAARRLYTKRNIPTEFVQAQGFLPLFIKTCLKQVICSPNSTLMQADTDILGLLI